MVETRQEIKRKVVTVTFLAEERSETEEEPGPAVSIPEVKPEITPEVKPEMITPEAKPEVRISEVKPEVSTPEVKPDVGTPDVRTPYVKPEETPKVDGLLESKKTPGSELQDDERRQTDETAMATRVSLVTVSIRNVWTQVLKVTTKKWILGISSRCKVKTSPLL